MFEYHKQIVRRLVEEGWNQGNVAVFDELIALNFTSFDPNNALVIDRESYKTWTLLLRQAFPDLHVTIIDMLAEMEKVAKHWKMSGIHQAEYLGVPASHHRVEIEGITLYFLHGDKIQRCIWSYDALGFFTQIGMFPELRIPTKS
jgi:steroid delta-isomerase-like uncharacterized protein